MISLNDHVPENIGLKARRLSELTRAGFSVPCGIVVPAAERITKDTLEANLKECSTDLYAVRSSFVLEDGEKHSFAGIFESEINVPREQVAEAAKRVRASADSPRAQRYGEIVGIYISRAGMSVIVQEMVKAELYGVCFTKHPTREDKMLISFTEHHEGVTGGGDGESIELVRSGEIANPLHAAIRDTMLEVERASGLPQDIEFAIRDCARDIKPIILQSRSITS